MDIKVVVVVVCLLHFSYATDPLECLSKYNTCLSIFGLTATGSDPLPSEQQLYTANAMHLLCSLTDIFVGCYDHMMTCLQLNRTEPGIMSNAQMTSVVETMCQHKSALVSGHQCLERINYTQISRVCANKTQATMTKLVMAGFSVKQVTCTTLKLSTDCLYTAPALLSCGNDLVSALTAISDASKLIMCDGIPTISPDSIVG